MNKLTTITKLLKRVGRKPELAACAMAALLFFSALSTEVRAQGGNTYGGATVVYAGAIELAPGQSVSVTVRHPGFLDASVKVVKSHGVTEYESGLVYSGESGGINDTHHTFTVTVSHTNLPGPGEPGADTMQVYIEVTLFPHGSTPERAEDLIAGVSPPTVEVRDRSNRTISLGILQPVVRTNSNPER